MEGSRVGGRGPIATSTVRLDSSDWKLRGFCSLSSTSRSFGPIREQLDEPGGGVLGEQGGRRDPQQPPTAAGLADLPDGPVLQPQDLGGPTGQSKPAGGERQA